MFGFVLVLVYFACVVVTNKKKKKINEMSLMCDLCCVLTMILVEND